MTPNQAPFLEPMDDFLPRFEDETRFTMDYSEFVFFLPPQNSEKLESPQEISTLKGYENRLMVKTNLSKKQLGFNILLLALLSIAAGWFGILLNLLTGQTNLALSVFLALPPMGVLILNLVYKNTDIYPGLKIQLKNNTMGYILAFLLFPVLVTITVIVGYLAGFISVDGLVNQGVGSLIGAVVLLFLTDLIKNCLEEFTWRGFFTQHFKNLGTHDLLNHLFTGIIWVFWHIPFWLFLLDKASISAFSSLNTATFILMGSLLLLASSLVFGEIRLLTGSVWPAVILHTSLNAVTIGLLLNSFVSVSPSAELWISPGGNSILMILMVVMVGLGLYFFRTSKKSIAP